MNRWEAFYIQGLHNLNLLVEGQQPADHNPLFTLGSFDWAHPQTNLVLCSRPVSSLVFLCIYIYIQILCNIPTLFCRHTPILIPNFTTHFINSSYTHCPIYFVPISTAHFTNILTTAIRIVLYTFIPISTVYFTDILTHVYWLCYLCLLCTVIFLTLMN
jgi:hypothetical protein